jgi:hypothetical protein
MGSPATAFAWRPVVVLAVAGALGWWILSWNPEPQTSPEPPEQTVETPIVERPWIPRPRTTAASPGCEPEASQRCIEGDVWWIDSCDHPHAVAKRCGDLPCHDGACESSDPPGCGGETAPGRCDGDVARGCDAGRPFAIDCGSKGKRCVETEAGPGCRTPSDDDCEGRAPSQCDGTHVVACIEGRWLRHDCSMRGAVCTTPPGVDGARCVALVPAAGDEECGACGCPAAPTEERCDGTDNDGNGLIDDGVVCEPVDIVAFMVVDSAGKGSHTRAEIEEEIERLDESFARDDGYELHFRLVDVVRLKAEDWIELDDDEIQAVFGSPTINSARDTFYIPVVFTERILVDEVPRPGLSSGPNGMCGGVRRTLDPQPPGGAVMLAKRRWPTTLAHEVGHFLGLCHTHADDVDVVQHWDAGATGSLADATACGRGCESAPDGICDTPLDPGPISCSTDPECHVACEDGAAPDPSNIMAYYPECRTGFSEEQALLMRQTVALRRDWHVCLFGDGCSCDPLAVPAQCPPQTTCRSFLDGGARAWRCDLDGASPPGATCRGSLDCSRGTLCLGHADGASRCVRPCDPALGVCGCQPLDDHDIGGCMDDLAGRD